jgi:hypothetical protein
MPTKRKSIEPEVESEVRRRARFICQACQKPFLDLNQYAHVIPHSRGGTLSIDNLVWLHEGCQRIFEPAHANAKEYTIMIQRLQEYRDRKVEDTPVSGFFEDFLSKPNSPVEVQAGSVGFRTIHTIFAEPSYSYKPMSLSFYREGKTLLAVRGMLKGFNGEPIVEFDGHNLTLHTGDVWDIVRKSKFFKLVSSDKKIWVEISQTNFIVKILGAVYAGDGIVTISDDEGIRLPAGGGVQNLTLEGIEGEGQKGIQFPSSTERRPFGHMSPNVSPIDGDIRKSLDFEQK